MRYLYYRLWQILKRMPTNDTPATNAMILLSIFQGVNIVTIQLLVNHYFDIRIKVQSEIEAIIFPCAIGLVLYLINYFYLYSGRQKLHEKYKDESRIRSIIGLIVLAFYIIISGMLVYYFGSRYPFLNLSFNEN